MRYPVSGAGDTLRAALFGQYSTDNAREYFAAGYKTLTSTQQEHYNMLVGDGYDREKVYDAIRTVERLKKGLPDKQEDATAAIKEIAGLSKRQRAALWRLKNTEWKAENNPFDTGIDIVKAYKLFME
jgi:hypothetical protein